MKIIYRISDTGYNKIKPPYVNNENCLKNFCKVFSDYNSDIKIIADNCSEETIKMINKYVDSVNIEKVSIGHGSGTFNLALDEALKYEYSEIIYFVENDYIHRQGAVDALLEGFDLGTDFLTLYDHLDKYIDGPNPYVSQGGEDTKVFLTKSCHWKFTNSTTMTFAGRVSSLRKYESIIRQYTNTSHPYDFDMWISMRNQGASLISPIPGYSTHGESAWLAPLINWNNVNSNT
jgi:hypothetical protein